MRSSTGIFAVGFVALMSACAPEEAAPDTESTEDELSSLQLSCRAGTEKFTVSANATGLLEGFLTTSAKTVRFACAEEPISDAGAPSDAGIRDAGKKKSDAGDAGVDAGPSSGGRIVARCIERLGGASSLSAVIREASDGDVTAEFTQGDGGAGSTLACGKLPVTDAGVSDGGPGDDDAGDDDSDGGPETDGSASIDAGPAPSGLTFADAQPIIDKKCERCHTGAFSTVQDIKQWRPKMISAIRSGRMPRGDSSWKDSPDGLLLLEWLSNGQEFQSP